MLLSGMYIFKNYLAEDHQLSTIPPIKPIFFCAPRKHLNHQEKKIMFYRKGREDDFSEKYTPCAAYSDQ